MNDAKNPLNVASDNLISDDADGNDRLSKNTKIVVPLKYLSNSFSSLEMSLINCKIHLVALSNFLIKKKK